mmetsp:Transcript_22959/g.44801  ORF Transcript_22959/g.44801 Transcript_22959/m.44801 type:complete len:242 (+) Transcript_22959:3-728(+)
MTWFESLPLEITQVGDKIVSVTDGTEQRVLRVGVEEKAGAINVSIMYEPLDRPSYVIENTTKYPIQLKQKVVEKPMSFANRMRMMTQSRKKKMTKKRNSSRDQCVAIPSSSSFSSRSSGSSTVKEDLVRWTWVMPGQRMVWGFQDLLQEQPYQVTVRCGQSETDVTMDNIGWSTAIDPNPPKPTTRGLLSRRKKNHATSSSSSTSIDSKVKASRKVAVKVTARGVTKVLRVQEAIGKKKNS